MNLKYIFSLAYIINDFMLIFLYYIVVYDSIDIYYVKSCSFVFFCLYNYHSFIQSFIY